LVGFYRHSKSPHSSSLLFSHLISSYVNIFCHSHFILWGNRYRFMVEVCLLGRSGFIFIFLISAHSCCKTTILSHLTLGPLLKIPYTHTHSQCAQASDKTRHWHIEHYSARKLSYNNNNWLIDLPNIIYIGHASEFCSRLILWQNNLVPGTLSWRHNVILVRSLIKVVLNKLILIIKSRLTTSDWLIVIIKVN